MWLLLQKSFVKLKIKKSFLDEVYNQTGFNFKVLSEEDQLKGIYTAVINTMDVPKGLIVEILSSSVQLIQYNRRNILNEAIINFGALNLAEKFDESELTSEQKCDETVRIFTEELRKLEWLSQFEPEYKIIGVGANFESVAKISQKAKKYPIDVLHMYEMNIEDVTKVFDTIKVLSLDKTKKIKGISEDRADVLASAVSIVKAIMEELKIEDNKKNDEDVEERKNSNF